MELETENAELKREVRAAKKEISVSIRKATNMLLYSFTKRQVISECNMFFYMFSEPNINEQSKYSLYIEFDDEDQRSRGASASAANSKCHEDGKCKN